MHMGLRQLVAVVAALFWTAGAWAQQPDHVSLTAHVDPAQGTLIAAADIRFPAVGAGDEINLILAPDMEVERADAGPHAEVALSSTHKPWPLLQIRVRFKQADRHPRLRISYRGRPNGGGRPPINMITPGLTELSLDGMWVPIRQDFSGRFTLDARVTGLPRGAVVTGQGDVRREGRAYRLVRRIPGFDATLIAAPGLRRSTERAFEFLARDPNSPQALLYREHGPRSIAWLERWLGPIPGAPIRLVMVERERGSGYARPGYVVVTDSRGGEPEGLAKFVAHEFAHAWFSNANPTGAHRWLDESLAEYAGLRYVEEAFGRAARDAMLEARRPRAAAAGPVVGANRGDRELYDKGALLMFALEERIGRPAIERLIARTAREHVAETPVFLAMLSDIAGAEAAAWFDEQLRS